MTTHGTRACYVKNKCRRPECREANRVQQKARRTAQLYGRYDAYVDAEPVRKHVEALSIAGVGRRRLAELSGVSQTAIQTLKNGTPSKRGGIPPARIRRETAEALMVITGAAQVAPHALVNARGSHRRIQALVARGWSRTRLAGLLGVSNLTAMLKTSSLTQQKADQIAALYEKLWDKTPSFNSTHEAVGARRAMNFARRNRWAPPLAWDDIDNDEAPAIADEKVALDEMAIELAMLGEPVKLNGAERRAAVTHLHAKRWSDQRIAATLRIADRTVLRIRQELNLESFAYGDLLQAVAA